MADLMVTVKQVKDTPTSAGTARQHQVVIDRPKEKGGLDEGAMGGELLLLALGGCFMSNLIAAAKARDVQIDDLSVDVHGTLAAAPPRFESIALEVHGRCRRGDLRQADPDRRARVHRPQHALGGCPGRSEAHLIRPSVAGPLPPWRIPRVGRPRSKAPTARHFRANRIRGQHLAAHSNLEARRLASVKYDASEDNAGTMMLPETCMPCRRPQRLPSYAAGYAGLSNSSSAHR